MNHLLHGSDSPLARSKRVVPVSVIPEVVGRTTVPAEPYVTVWSIPTNVLAGDVDVIGLYGDQ